MSHDHPEDTPYTEPEPAGEVVEEPADDEGELLAESVDDDEEEADT